MCLPHRLPLEAVEREAGLPDMARKDACLQLQPAQVAKNRSALCANSVYTDGMSLLWVLRGFFMVDHRVQRLGE